MQSSSESTDQTPSTYNANMYNTGTYNTTYSDQASAMNTQGGDQNYLYQQYYSSQYYNYPQQQANTASVGYDYNNGNYYNYADTYTSDAKTAQIGQSSSGSSTSTTAESKSDTSVKKPESSIDLLSGIDFNISVTPLVPQQKTEAAENDKVNEKESEVVKPKVVDVPPVAPVISTTKSEEKVKPITVIRKKIVKPATDPFQNTEIVKQFIQEVDKFEKFCDTLVTKTLNGPTTLDLKWKEIQDRQENESYNRSISVARCYPLKNKFPDILPYDYSRVELRSTKDDYINASYVKVFLSVFVSCHFFYFALF